MIQKESATLKEVQIRWDIRKSQKSESGSTSNSSSEVLTRKSSSSSSGTIQSIPKKGSAMMKKMEKLKVTTRRGRPKKHSVKPKENKHFLIPEKYRLFPIETK